MNNTYTYKLSVIVVNYNVEHFLNQCLNSVSKAANGQSVEVIVVDNCSVDGSLKMLESNYPNITIIANKENVGFSKANNQGIAKSAGEYVLLLNPDTVVEEDSFGKIIRFMDEHPEAGGLGVRMIDGKGEFLPESKRGLPSPKVAFYKIFGLSALFPKSRKFSQYHLGHLSEFETNEIDILSGAFMLMRKSTLDKIGLLDENFFMYGEDIDLSYRIQLGGYKNYYFPETSIIHYKGESTKKSSVNYVFVFYNAMIIFAKKHFTGKNAHLFSLLINLGIYLRAFVALCVRFIKRITLPLIDFLYILIGLFALTNYWKMSSIEFPTELIKYSIPLYALTWLSSCFFNGGYDQPLKLFKFLKGVFWATILILIVYAVLPKSWQFSRLFIFIGAGWVILYYLLSRLFLHFTIGKKFNLTFHQNKNFVVFGSDEEFQRIKEILKQTNPNVGTISRVDDDLSPIDTSPYDEVVFSSKDISYSKIIEQISTLKSEKIDFKIAPNDGNLLIGSNSIDTAGDLYILNLNLLVSNENKRKKRLFDIVFSGLLLLLFPISFFLFKSKINYLINLVEVFIGKISFIGYSEDTAKKDVRLPKIKSGILSPADGIDQSDELVREKLNVLYSRDYSMRKDFAILFKSWRKLDQ